MSNTTRIDFRTFSRRVGLFAAAVLGVALVFGNAAAQTLDAKESGNMTAQNPTPVADCLSAEQQAILPIAAFAAAGDMDKLDIALNRGLDAGLTINDAREVLIQLYAYAGFPRSLNALTGLMKVVDARKQRGLHDAPGRAPGHAIPTGDALLATGKANQTRLVGQPVAGPIFEFAPAIGEYLQSHLLGAIFERDNLDWQNRELATVGMLSGMSGVEAQLQSHMHMSMNTGLTANQMQQAVEVLQTRVGADNGRRAREALQRALAPAQH